MIWFATLKPRGNHILFISAYKSIEIGAEGIFLKTRWDCSPHNPLKVKLPPVSTISAALLGRETEKKRFKWNLATKADCAHLGTCPCQWSCRNILMYWERKGKVRCLTTATFLRQTSVINWIFCALWDYINCSNVSDQNASKKPAPPWFFISWLSVATWGIFQNFAFPPPNLDEGMEPSHVQSTRPYWWQDITCGSEEFLL